MKCVTLVLSSGNFWNKIYQATHFGNCISGLVGWVVSYSTYEDGLHSENFKTVNTVKTTKGKDGTDSQHIRDVPYGFTVRKNTTSRGGVVVEALRYKPVGGGFDSRWCH